MLYVGEGPRGSNGTCSTVHQIEVTPSATHNQIGPLWCWFPNGWACARPRPLWVFPRNSPVRLGVSPAAAPSLTGIFTQVWGCISPCTGALGCAVCFVPSSCRVIYVRMWDRGVLPAALPAPFSATLSPALSVYLWVTVGPQGLLVVRLPAPFVPHSASLCLATATWVLSAPVPVSSPPTGLDACFFFIYLVLDFLAVRFSVSAGWLCEEAQCVYLCCYLGSLPQYWVSKTLKKLSSFVMF